MKLGKVFILSAPAGTGKTTVAELLCKRHPHLVANISFTTRARRVNEKEGIDYHFISEAEFQKKEREGIFLETVELFGSRYGSDRKQIEALQKKGKHVLLVIDTQGAQTLRKKIPAVFIFMEPPSLAELKRRLQARSTESEEVIEARLAKASQEMEKRDLYDYLVVNRDLETTCKVLESIIIAEEHRRS